MFSLGAWLALQVTTSTPDALCPPLDETREAIATRVGEVRAEYHADFALIRGQDGSRALRLDLRLNEQLVLERELPLGPTGCDDVAQTIALVLERYFDAIDRPDSPPPVPDREPVPEIVEPSVSQAATPAPVSERSFVDPARGRHHPLRAAAGVQVARQLGWAPRLSVELRPLAVTLTSQLRLGWGLSIAPFFAQPAEVVREQKLTEKTLQIATWLPLELERGHWSVGLGPWAQLRVQRAEGSSLARQRPVYRSLPGFGGAANLGWSATGAGAGLLVGLSGAAGAQLIGAGARFVVRDADGNLTQVLVPETAFAQVALELGFIF